MDGVAEHRSRRGDGPAVLGVWWPPGSAEPEQSGAAQGGGAGRWARYGRGWYDPRTDLWEWYEDVPVEEATPSGSRLTWDELFAHWLEIECDLFDAGIDVEDRELMRSRSWRWLLVHIVGLLHADTRLARSIYGKNQPLQAS